MRLNNVFFFHLQKLKNSVTPHLLCEICDEDECEHAKDHFDNTKEMDTLLKEKNFINILPAVNKS